MWCSSHCGGRCSSSGRWHGGRVVRADLVAGSAGGLCVAGGAGSRMGAQRMVGATVRWVFSEWGGGGYGCRCRNGRAGIGPGPCFPVLVRVRAPQCGGGEGAWGMGVEKTAKQAGGAGTGRGRTSSGCGRWRICATTTAPTTPPTSWSWTRSARARTWCASTPRPTGSAPSRCAPRSTSGRGRSWRTWARRGTSCATGATWWSRPAG